MKKSDVCIEDLNERERSVLHHVVYNYIQTAVPVGSRYISKHFEQGLSAASIRNIMADLEERGYLSHPHTSAGRIPTDLGYRFYIDYLMEIQQISKDDKEKILKQLDVANNQDELLKETSRLLGKISRQLSIVTSPQLSSGIFEKIELISITNSKILVVISVSAGLVRTIMMEVGAEIKRDNLDQVSRLMNERLSGLTLSQIRDSFADRVRDIQGEKSGLIRLFIESVDQLFNDDKEKDKVHIGGTKNIIEQPEFVDPKNFRSIIELIENEDVIVHLLEKHGEAENGFVVTVGKENDNESTNDYSLISSTYELEGVKGKVAIVGPRRMDYAKVIPLVDYVAKTIAKMMG